MLSECISQKELKAAGEAEVLKLQSGGLMHEITSKMFT